MRATLAAERLSPAVARVPSLHELLALRHAQRAGNDAPRCRPRAARAALAAPAVAVTRRHERLVELVAHAFAIAAAGQHGRSLSVAPQYDERTRLERNRASAMKARRL